MDDIFRFDENGRKFSKPVENLVGKDEIARDEQFRLFPQCFQKTFIADTYNPGLVLERVNPKPDNILSNMHCRTAEL